jgi:hypothetical protein
MYALDYPTSGLLHQLDNALKMKKGSDWMKVDDGQLKATESARPFG